ncbi:hypothetical protein [Flavivirga rizhaonensis]|uniref:DUF4365 domain-containing protein n=1 Tax=Flavivirga rizhaonensis TaxID=2559571 RepID=A0A4S1DS75_9FLAO|nr:hypothetical protein [Flavivirga rizhaonensis]TGV00575.1 hypothetical protein EM932_19135 [Flavivirga rizhaonensis]
MSSLILDFLKSELKTFDLKLTTKIDGREGLDFLIGDNQLYLQSIDLDTTQRSIKIAKQDLGELRDNLFVALVLIIDKTPRVLYLIPSKQLLESDNDAFVNNEVSLMPSLSNWEIKIFSRGIEELEMYAISNQVEKLF